MDEERYPLLLDITITEADTIVLALNEMLEQAKAVKAEGFDVDSDIEMITRLMKHVSENTEHLVERIDHYEKSNFIPEGP